MYLVSSMVTLDQLSSEEWLVDLECLGGGGMFVVVMHWSQSSSVDRYNKNKIISSTKIPYMCR